MLQIHTLFTYKSEITLQYCLWQLRAIPFYFVTRITYIFHPFQHYDFCLSCQTAQCQKNFGAEISLCCLPPDPDDESQLSLGRNIKVSMLLGHSPQANLVTLPLAIFLHIMLCFLEHFLSLHPSKLRKIQMLRNIKVSFYHCK